MIYKLKKSNFMAIKELNAKKENNDFFKKGDLESDEEDLANGFSEEVSP